MKFKLRAAKIRRAELSYKQKTNQSKTPFKQWNSPWNSTMSTSLSFNKRMLGKLYIMKGHSVNYGEIK